MVSWDASVDPIIFGLYDADLIPPIPNFPEIKPQRGRLSGLRRAWLAESRKRERLPSGCRRLPAPDGLGTHWLYSP